MKTPGCSATATIEPSGPKMIAPRGHLIRLTLELGASGGRHADKAHAAAVAREALSVLATENGAADQSVSDLTASPGGSLNAISGSVVLAERPDAAMMSHFRATLRAEGYSVSLKETRECGHPECSASVTIEWKQAAPIPTGWYSSTICGKHDYRSCSFCGSTYQMSSTNSIGQAPSLHCLVCGAIMVEWGGTKVWSAELVAMAK